MWLLIEISPKFVPEAAPIDNSSSMAEVMAWHQAGDKPLPQAMMVKFCDVTLATLGHNVLTMVSYNRFLLHLIHVDYHAKNMN